MTSTFPDEPRSPNRGLMFDDELEIERTKAGATPSIAPLAILPIYLIAVAFDYTVGKFFRAMKTAYGHVLSGTKVDTPTRWRDI